MEMKVDTSNHNSIVGLIIFLFITILAVYPFSCACQLVVNIKNKGGDVVVESIKANTSSNTITLEFRTTDGTLVTQFIDFKSEVQIFRAYILWEEERGFAQYKPQVVCFVTRFTKNDFISSDAMSKLRQKNPTAIRMPEEERTPEIFQMDIEIDIEKSVIISPHVYNICQDATGSTFGRETDIRMWTRSLGKDPSALLAATKKSFLAKYSRCRETNDITKPCTCRFQICVGWYPCGLKYCRGKDSSGKYVSYRCGIKTCKRHLSFDHVAKQKLYCLWDDL